MYLLLSSYIKIYYYYFKINLFQIKTANVNILAFIKIILSNLKNKRNLY